MVKISNFWGPKIDKNAIRSSNKSLISAKIKILIPGIIPALLGNVWLIFNLQKHKNQLCLRSPSAISFSSIHRVLLPQICLKRLGPKNWSSQRNFFSVVFIRGSPPPLPPTVEGNPSKQENCFCQTDVPDDLSLHHPHQEKGKSAKPPFFLLHVLLSTDTNLK